MAYVAMYREWRPKTFADIIGQKHISQTLQNAVQSGRIAHAYLFSGPRGTGKTSTAKVLAKALNCTSNVGTGTDSQVEPCNECENCVRINQGTSMDVLEIDAASNRGIDEIRDLREKVKFAPVEGKYKVYIIDEVHMLTNEAFNALLKTLEEPPSYVVFVLATTEPHKIPLTILSRCQRFDFRRIALEDIIDRLEYIAGQAGLQVSPEALFLIARTAEGGMRDALSILDQCVAYGGDSVDAGIVHGVIGTVSSGLLSRVAEAAAAGDVVEALQVIDVLTREGKDLRQFLRDLIDYLRDLILVKITSKPEELLRGSTDNLAKLQEQSALFSQDELMGIMSILTEADQAIRWSTQPRLVLELSLIKGVQYKGKQDLTALARRLEEVENKVVELDSRPAASVPTAKPATARQAKTGGQSKTYQAVDLGPEDQALLEEVSKVWQEVNERLKKQSRSTQAFLVEAQLHHAGDNCLTLVCQDIHSFHRDKLVQPENKRMVERILEQLLNRPMQLRVLLTSELKANNDTKTKKQEPGEKLVQEAQSLFGEALVEITD